jgi:hypothetical protein
MAAVKIKYLPASMMLGMYREDSLQYAKDALAAGSYKEESHLFYVLGISKDAADEVFDLTNNPSRQPDRESVYGFGRSLSVGDIVEVYNPDFSIEQWLCCSFGWKEL